MGFGDPERQGRAVRVRHGDEMEWVRSPAVGVWRKRFLHEGAPESGRVTSLVRYDAGSRFHAHDHPGGEEILVLEGVFSDERGDHGAGVYLLNPEGFRHAPYSDPGCVLLVSLRRYEGAGRRTVRVDSRQVTYHAHPDHDGVRFLPLYSQPGFAEEMRLVKLPAGAALGTVALPRGEEIFVVEGSFSDEHGSYRQHSWVQYPAGSSHSPRTETGCLLYVKKGHLGG